jgi:hypothetical protein
LSHVPRRDRSGTEWVSGISPPSDFSKVSKRGSRKRTKKMITPTATKQMKSG